MPSSRRTGIISTRRSWSTRRARIIGKYRKVHLPGHAEFDPKRTHQHLEKRYFEPGDLGFPVWRTLGGVIGMCICNDRRWPETYRVLGLQGVEMVVLGFNTPSVNCAETATRVLGKRHVPQPAHRSRPAPIRTRPAWSRSRRPAWKMGTNAWPAPLIVNPDGEIVAEAKTEDDELLVHDCDLERRGLRQGNDLRFRPPSPDRALWPDRQPRPALCRRKPEFGVAPSEDLRLARLPIAIATAAWVGSITGTPSAVF